MDLTTHLLPHDAAKLLGDSLGHRHGGHTTRLSAADLASDGEPLLGNVLCDLRGLPTASLTNHYEHLVVLHSLHRRGGEGSTWRGGGGAYTCAQAQPMHIHTCTHACTHMHTHTWTSSCLSL